MPRQPFWSTEQKAQITTPRPLERTLEPEKQGGRAARLPLKVAASKPGETRLSFSDNLSQLYELWEAQRAELQASAEPLPKRIEALGRLARVLPQLAVAERLHKAKRGDKAIEEMSDDELQAMLSKELSE